MSAGKAHLPIRRLDDPLNIPHCLPNTNQFSLNPKLRTSHHRPKTRNRQRPGDGPILHEARLRIHMQDERRQLVQDRRRCSAVQSAKYRTEGIFDIDFIDNGSTFGAGGDASGALHDLGFPSARVGWVVSETFKQAVNTLLQRDGFVKFVDGVGLCSVRLILARSGSHDLGMIWARSQVGFSPVHPVQFVDGLCRKCCQLWTSIGYMSGLLSGPLHIEL
jgi:hypothetical protein